MNQGIKGTQQRMVCPNCAKVFFSWRPSDLPGAEVKCYFCGHKFQDEAARRPPLPVPAPAAAAVPEPSAPAPAGSAEPS